MTNKAIAMGLNLTLGYFFMRPNLKYNFSGWYKSFPNNPLIFIVNGFKKYFGKKIYREFYDEAGKLFRIFITNNNVFATMS